MTKIAEDLYTLTSKDTKKTLLLDLTTPFIVNSVSAIINVPYEDIIIKNSIGTIVETIKKEDLLTIDEKDIIGEDVTYYFLNLIDILYDPIEVEGYTYSKLFPLKELEDNEYGLVNGKLVTGKDILVRVKGIELIKTEVDVVKVVNYANGNFMKRLDTDFTYYDEQTLDSSSLNYIVKLNSVAIEKGSLKIEEYYEDGVTYSSTAQNDLQFINVNTTDEPQYLEVEEDTYLQE